MVSNPYNYKIIIRADASPIAKIVAVLLPGAQVASIGRTFDNVWLLLLLPNGHQAWVYAKAIIVDPDYLATLPIVTPNAYK